MRPVRANPSSTILKGPDTMITTLSSPKPGTGVTTTAALLSLAICHDRQTHIVDFAGDQAAVLGADTRPGTIRVTEQITLHNLSGLTTEQQVAAIRDIADSDDHVIVDVGPAGHPTLGQLPIRTIHRWVLRPCYLTLRRAGLAHRRPEEVILLEELGRALTTRDVEAVTGAPVVATIEIHPQIVRAIDAGLLTTRPPRATLARLAALKLRSKDVMP